MNFKSTSFLLLSISLLAQSSNVFADKVNSLEKIKTLETSLIKNKNSIDNLLNTKAHTIPKELDSLLANSRYTSLSSAIRMVAIDSVKNTSRDDLFTSPNAIADMIKGLGLTPDEHTDAVINPNEKIYSLIVLNPQNLEVMNKVNAAISTSMNQKDDLVTRMGRLIDLSMKGKRFLTFKEADALSSQVAKMNSDLNQVDELQVQLSSKDQLAVEAFKKNMNEWMNKRIVFVGINKKGITADVKSDFATWLPVSYKISSIQLEQNYTAAAVASKLKQTIIQSITTRHAESNWDDFAFVVPKAKSGMFESSTDNYKVSVNDLKDLTVSVSEDRKLATIATKRFSFSTPIGYGQTSTFLIKQNGAVIYNHESQNQEGYYGGNPEMIKTLLKLITVEEIQMTGITKNYGLDSFITDLNDSNLSVK